MRANSFFYRHYLAAGESFSTHAAAVLVGAVLMAVGAALVFTVAFLPVGVAIGLLGLLIFGGGVFGHIQSPVKFRDLLDSVVSLSGAAIGMTFALAVMLFLVVVGFGIVAALVEWLRRMA